MSIQPRLSRFFRAAARPTPLRRLRAMYWSMAAMAALSLGMLALTLRAARIEAQTVRVCRVEVLLPGDRVLAVPPPPVRRTRTKVAHNMRRAAGATKEK